MILIHRYDAHVSCGDVTTVLVIFTTLYVFSMLCSVFAINSAMQHAVHCIGGGDKFKVLTLEVQHKYADFLKMSESSSDDIGI